MATADHSRGLLLVGHGSLVSDAASRSIRALADRLRASSEYHEVKVAFWRERPTLREAWGQFTAPDIVCVPMLAATGWFCDVVLPRELGLSGQTTRIGPHRVVYTAAVGTHDTMTDVVLERASTALHKRGWDRETTTILLIGHGTPRRGSSRDTVERHASRARAAGYAGVETAFIDAEPSVETACARISTEHCVAVPFFMSDGPHTQVDIPRTLAGCKFAVETTAPVGTDASVMRVVEELAAAATPRFADGEFVETLDPWHRGWGQSRPPNPDGWTAAVARFEGRLAALQEAPAATVRECAEATCATCPRSPTWIVAETGPGEGCPDPCPELMEQVMTSIRPRRA